MFQEVSVIKIKHNGSTAGDADASVEIPKLHNIKLLIIHMMNIFLICILLHANSKSG